MRGQIGGNFYSSPFTNGTIYDNHYVRMEGREMNKDMRKKDITNTAQNSARSNRGNNR